MKNKTNTDNIELNFATITPSGIIVPDLIDKKQAGCDYVRWGDDNKLPNYLWDNYLKCSNLQAIVNTILDYIYGEGIETNYNLLSSNDETINEVVKKCIFDYIIFGGFTVECIRNYENNIVRINYQNVMNVRLNETLTTAYISSTWNTWNCKNVKQLPLYDKNTIQPHFIFYFRGNITRNINPIPCYVSALKSIAILNNTRNFHLRNLENGFSARTIINLNNGNIKTRELEEIKRKLEEGYCGTENAGKFLLLNGGDKDHASTVEKLDADNFGDLYKSLSETSVDDIYVAFRINKMLVGVNIQTGFSKEEFQNAYELFYSTVIIPFKNDIKKQFAKIGVDIIFKPFIINWKE